MKTYLTRTPTSPLLQLAAASLSLLGILFSQATLAQSIDDVVLNVYKSESCGCCVGWIEHMNAHSYHSNIFHPSDLDGVKQELGIKHEWAS